MDSGQDAEEVRGVAGWLREAREARKWSQEKLAEVSGVPQATISRYERGAAVKRESVKKIARAVTGSEEKAAVAVALSEMPEMPVRVVRLALDIAELSERDQNAVIALVEALKQ